MALIAFTALTYRQHCSGIDLRTFYTGSKAFLQGRPLYAPGVMRDTLNRSIPPALLLNYDKNNDADCNPYPPSAALLQAPLALFDFYTARTVTLFFMMGTLIAGFWVLLKTAAPQWPLSSRLLLIFVVLESISVRWGLEILQFSPLLLGFFAVFLTALLRGQGWVAGVLGIAALGVKVSLALPFLLLPLLLRRWRLSAFMLCGFLLLNGIGFARVGGLAAVRDYPRHLARMASLEINSPDPHNPLAGERTDWEYFFNGVHAAPAAHKIAQFVSLLALAWLGMEAYRSRRLTLNTELLAALALPAACLTLLVAYHHNYDACLLLAPMALYLSCPEIIRAQRAAKWACGLIVFYACLRPGFKQIGQAISFLLPLESRVAERMIASVSVTIIFALSLRILRHTIQTASESKSEKIS